MVSLWLVYGLLITGVFLHVLFPAETLRRYFSSQIFRLDANLEMEIGHLRLAFPVTLRFQNVVFKRQGQPLLEAPLLDLKPAIHFSRRTPLCLYVQAQIAGGQVSGCVPIVFSSTGISFQIDGLQLEQLSVLASFPDVRMTGALSGEVQTRSLTPDTPVLAHLSMRDLHLRLDLPLLGFEELDFRDGTLHLSVQGRQLKIQQLELLGNQLNAHFQGHLQVHDYLEASTIDLQGRLQLHPVYATTLKQKLPPGWLQPPAAGRDYYSVQVQGALASPALRVN